MTHDAAALFAEPLVDLGRDEARFAGILTPRSARGMTRRGVTAQFIENAADYHAAYTNRDHFAALIGNALASLERPLDARVILDLGSGSGNSVIPLLERFPDAFVVATDISPQLLAILRDELIARGEAGRVALVCMDASTNPYRSGTFDLAVGAAVLHHVIEPERVIRACETALRPRGAALFFEPFETGQAVLHLAYDAILREADRRGESSTALAAVRQMHEDYLTRLTIGERVEQLDDKWLFTRSFFEALARAGDWSACRVAPIHGDASPLVQQTRTNLKLAGGAGDGDLPEWAWSILARHESAFTPAGRRDMPLEAAIVLERGDLAVDAAAGPSLSGWWWNPAEGGRGFFIDADASAVRLVACAYDDAGDPVWRAAGPAPMGRDILLASSSGSSGAPNDAASPRLRFDGDAQALLEWGRLRVRLQPQHAEVAAFRSAAWRNLTGWWIEHAATPRCSAVIENLDTRLVAALLTPDAWCITVAERSHGRRYDGQWLRFSGGQTMTSDYRPPAAPQVLGPARLAWSDTDTLVLTAPDGRKLLMRRLASSG